MGYINGHNIIAKEALDTSYKERTPQDHQVIARLPRHASVTMDRFFTGKDGRAAHERARGRKPRREVAYVGECAWALAPGSNGTQASTPGEHMEVG